LSGWQISSIITKQSGPPFSIISGRGTLNRSGQSGINTANSSLTSEQLFDLIKVRFAPNGPYYLPASVIGGDGRGAAADGSPAFDGQAFFQPGAGTVGQLQRRMFSSPWVFTADFAVSKTTKIIEGHELVFRMDSANIFNHPTWRVEDSAANANNTSATITATNFGRITNTFYGRRVLQFGLTYRF
jgi:hypothetical protein